MFTQLPFSQLAAAQLACNLEHALLNRNTWLTLHSLVLRLKLSHSMDDEVHLVVEVMSWLLKSALIFDECWQSCLQLM